jgi:hypothetical protein
MAASYRRRRSCDLVGVFGALLPLVAFLNFVTVPAREPNFGTEGAV